MPKTVTIEVDPAFPAPKSGDGKAAYDSAKAKGPLTVSFVAAQEAVKLSGGMYRIRPEGQAPLPSAPPLQSLPTEELKRMYFAMGGKVSEKPIKRSEIITFISSKMDAFEVLDDEALADGGGE